MALLTFKGGIHPDDGKRLAKDKAIVDVKPTGDLVYPVSQHIGAPANPIVAVGDHVLKGQMIAEAGGFVSAPIYASVSGTVKAIAPHLNPTGGTVNSIVIENDGEYKEVEYPAVKPVDEMTKEEILNAIGNAGVVGMGGAGFPTRVKLSPKEPDKIDYIIANCAECEPYITADYRTMIETPEKLVEGMKIVLNPSPMNAKILSYPLEYVDYFLLNEVEASDICGIEATKDPQALMNGLVKQFPEAKIVLTLGGDGSVYRDGDTVLRQGIYKVPVVDTTAAGDTFTGYFIGGLQLGEDPKTALEHAAKAAAIAVSRPGAAPSVPNREEVETFEG